MRILSLLCLFMLGTGCASYKPTFPTTESAQTESLYVQPVLNQEEVAVQVVIADSSASTMQYGALGALIGAIVDSAVNNSRAKKAERKAEVLREATVDYDLIASLREAASTEQTGGGWNISMVGDVSAETDIRQMVADKFAASEVDTVIALTATYQLTPTVDQVNVSITQEVFPRHKVNRSTKRQMPSSTRYISYQSPIHAVSYRPYNDGEKEELKKAITYEYEQSIAIKPEEETTLRAALAKELEEIEESTEIPEDRAIAETWTPERLAMYLDESKKHLRFMLEYDWNETEKPDMASANLEDFYPVLATGMRVRQRGLNVGELDDNVVYRTAGGAIYSVPPSD